MISSSKLNFSEKQWHFLSIWNNYSRLKILCNIISLMIWDASLCNCYSFYIKNPEPAPEKWKTIMSAERHQMRFLELFNGLLSYPVGIQMCCSRRCTERYNDCCSPQSVETRTLQNVRLQVALVCVSPGYRHIANASSAYKIQAAFSSKSPIKYQTRRKECPQWTGQSAYSSLYQWRTVWNGVCFSRPHSCCNV